MTLKDELAALRREIEALRAELTRSNAMNARTPMQVAAPWPHNIPQQLWGEPENRAALQEQQWHMRNPGALLQHSAAAQGFAAKQSGTGP